MCLSRPVPRSPRAPSAPPPVRPVCPANHTAPLPPPRPPRPPPCPLPHAPLDWTGLHARPTPHGLPAPPQYPPLRPACLVRHDSNSTCAANLQMAHTPSPPPPPPQSCTPFAPAAQPMNLPYLLPGPRAHPTRKHTRTPCPHARTPLPPVQPPSARTRASCTPPVRPLQLSSSAQARIIASACVYPYAGTHEALCARCVRTCVHAATLTRAQRVTPPVRCGRYAL
jgi:hypothetical protein